MNVYAKPGSPFQVIDNREKPECPPGHIEMKDKRPSDGNYIASESGDWIVNPHDPAAASLSEGNSEARGDRELVKLHKTDPNGAFKKLLDNVIRGKEEIDL